MIRANGRKMTDEVAATRGEFDAHAAAAPERNLPDDDSWTNMLHLSGPMLWITELGAGKTRQCRTPNTTS